MALKPKQAKKQAKENNKERLDFRQILQQQQAEHKEDVEKELCYFIQTKDNLMRDCRKKEKSYHIWNIKRYFTMHT